MNDNKNKTANKLIYVTNNVCETDSFCKSETFFV